MLSLLRREQPGPAMSGGPAASGVAREGSHPAPIGASAAGSNQARPAEELDQLLDRLLSDEQADRYTSEEYERTLREAEQRAQRVVLRRTAGGVAVPVSWEEGERHFLLVGGDLVGQAPEPEVTAAVCREAQRSYVRFARRGAVGSAADARQLARRAGAASGEAGGPWVWETPEVLDLLREMLTIGSRWEAEASGDLLVGIGEAAVPLLIEVLATSESLSVRRRALVALEALATSPAPQLVPLLATAAPWYLQRNAAYVLRRRRDGAGAAAARALWSQAEPRVRLELLSYLLAIGDAERLRLLDEVLADRDSEMATAAARIALKEPTAETVSAVLRRAEQVPADQVGLPFHLALLRVLAGCRAPDAVRYVAELPGRRRPLLPWQRERFRRQVAAMVAAGS
jgi:hypothetical protein